MSRTESSKPTAPAEVEASASATKLAYLGTSPFAVTVLRRLADSPFRPALVVTPPDRRQGRGRSLAPPPVAEAATELGLPLHQTASVSEPESVAALREAGVTVAMVCAFGQLIKPHLLDELEFLNVHPSLLPRWRGAAPIERAIMTGDPQTGVAIMRLTEGLDSGPVATLERVVIGPRDDFGALSARLAELGGRLSVRALERHAAGELEFTEQPEEGITYAEKIEAADRRLDPQLGAPELERTVRALHPHIGAWIELQSGERLGITRASVSEAELPPGETRAAEDGQALLIGTGHGSLRAEAVKPPGKREMAAADYLRGHGPPRLA